MSHRERYTIRRDDHAVLDRELLETILRRAPVARLGVLADDEPYVVPMNFAWDGRRIIVHGATEGRFISAIQKHPRVCVEVDEFLATLPNPVLCKYDTAYVSVIAYGNARLLDDLRERTDALRELAQKYATASEAKSLKERTVEAYRSARGSSTAVIEIVIDVMTGKFQPLVRTTTLERPSSSETSTERPATGPRVEPRALRHFVIQPGDPVMTERGVVKWYEIRAPAHVIPRPVIQAGRTLVRQAFACDDQGESACLSCAILHWVDDTATIWLARGFGQEQLFLSLYRLAGAGNELLPVRERLDASGIPAAVLAVLSHEREAGIRVVDAWSGRTDLEAWLDDVLIGTV